MRLIIGGKSSSQELPNCSWQFHKYKPAESLIWYKTKNINGHFSNSFFAFYPFSDRNGNTPLTPVKPVRPAVKSDANTNEVIGRVSALYLHSFWMHRYITVDNKTTMKSRLWKSQTTSALTEKIDGALESVTQSYNDLLIFRRRILETLSWNEAVKLITKQSSLTRTCFFLFCILKVDKEFCLERPSGNYADPYDCSSFYSCSLEETKRETCPRGLHYNYNTGECDWPFNVKCAPPPPYKPRIRKVSVYKPGNDKAMTINGFITQIMAVAKRRTIRKV